MVVFVGLALRNGPLGEGELLLEEGLVCRGLSLKESRALLGCSLTRSRTASSVLCFPPPFPAISSPCWHGG